MTNDIPPIYSIREFKDKLSGVLRELITGQKVYVRRRNKVIAEITKVNEKKV